MPQRLPQLVELGVVLQGDGASLVRLLRVRVDVAPQYALEVLVLPGYVDGIQRPGGRQIRWLDSIGDYSSINITFYS